MRSSTTARIFVTKFTVDKYMMRDDLKIRKKIPRKYQEVQPGLLYTFEISMIIM